MILSTLFKGRRRSRSSLLKVYMVSSSVATFLTIACVAKGSLTLEVMGGFPCFDHIEFLHVLIII